MAKDAIRALRDILATNWSKPPEPSIEDIADLDKGDAKRVRMLDNDIIRIFETAHNEAQPELIYDYVNEHVNITIDCRTVDSRERLSEMRDEVRRIIHAFRKGDNNNFDRLIYKTRTDLSDRSKKLFRYTLQCEIITFSLLATAVDPVVNPADGQVSGGNTFQSYDGDLTTLAALTPSDGVFIVGNGVNWVAESGATARTSLGLGSMATQNSDAISITGGSISGVSGLVSSITAGTGITGSATEGAVTLNVGGLTVSELAADSLQTSSETFGDNDTSLMTSAAIQDKIQSFGYALLADITSGVDLTGGTGVLIQSETNTASGDYSATIALDLKDEDDFASNSDTHAASQQSIKQYVTTRISNLLGGAPAALDTLDELAAAINDDSSFSATITTALGNRLRVDTNAQGLTTTQQENARANLGLNAGSVPSAGTGIDISGTGQFSVDVSDFMGSGANNRVLTATGTDAFQGEATLTYDGQVLRIDNGGDEVITIGGGGTGYQSIELGGDTGAYIDLKSPNSDDFDIRIITTGNGGEIVTASPLTFKTSSNNDDITFAPHGTGKVKFGASGFTLPTADGSANQTLKTDGSGALTFQDDLNHTYAISSATASGGANIVLTAGGSGSGTDTVKITGGTNTTVTQNNDEITLVSADTTYSVSTSASGSDARINLTAGGSGSGTDFVTLAAGSNITIEEAGDTITITAASDVDTTYDFLVAQTSGTDDNPALRLDPSTGSNDDITIVGGTNVTVTRNSDTQLTIDSADTNTFRTVTAGGNTLGASETLAFTAGSNVTITESGGAVTIASSGKTQEEIEDIVASLVVAGSNITKTYDDAAGTLTIASTDTNTQLSQEQVEDFVAGVIVAGSNITKTYDDTAGTLTIASTDTNTQLSQEQVEDFVGGMLDGTETFISVSYDDTDGNLDFVVPVLDEDNMASNSATNLATQQSIKAYIDSKTASIVDSAPATLDTLNELAAALGDDASFSTTTATSLGNRLRIDDNQSLTSTQQTQGLTNLGITASIAEINILTSGLSASDIPNLATSKITSGTFADARIAESNVTQHQAALSITESQISDLQSYLTAPRTVTAGGNTLANGETLAFTAGSNVTITESAGAVTIASTDTNTQYSAGSGIALSSTTFSVAAGNGLAQEASGLKLDDPANLSELDESTDATDDKILLWDESASSWKYMTLDNLQDSIDTTASGGAGEAFKTLSVSGQSDVVADAAADTLTLVAGSNITITTDASADSITITGTDTTYSAGTGLDLTGTTFSVDVSDFLTNGANNRVVTATGTDALNGEANLIWDGTNLGVGKSSPLFPLHLQYTNNRTDPEGSGSSSGAGAIGANAQGGGLYIENKSTTDGSWAGVTFRTDTADARIAYQSVGSSLTNEGQMSFFLDTNDSPNQLTLEEVLRLRGGASGGNQTFNSAYINGRLGVGISSPTDALHVRAASDHPLVIENTANAGYAGIQFSDNSDGSYAQKGEFRFNHADSNSEGSGASFHFTTTESDLSIVGGKFISAVGSASEPGFSFSGDTNVGMFRPATNELAFSVVNEAMRIDSNGNVGIGTTSPATRLHIERSESDTENLMIRLRDSTVNATGERIGIEGYWNTVPAGDIEFELTNTSSGASAIVFSPHSSGGTKTEAMRIASDGNVGIGTTSPMNTLQVNHSPGDGNQGILIVRDDATTTANEVLGGIGFDSTDGNVPSSVLEASAAIVAKAREAHSTGDKGGYLEFMFSPTDQDDDSTSTVGMTFMDGKLAVNNFGQHPQTSLTVFHQAGDFNDGITVINRNTTIASGDLLGAIGFDGRDGNAPSRATEASAGIAAFASQDHSATEKGGHLTFFTAPDDQDDDTASLERMRIASNGNVGIGTTSPGEKLHVGSGNVNLDAGYYYAFRDRGDLGMKELNYSVSLMAPEEVYIQIDSNSNNNDDTFFAVQKNGNAVGGGTELFRVGEDGNVGIGTSSPVSELDLNTGALSFANTNTQLKLSGGSNVDLQLGHWGNTHILIDTDGNDSSRYFSVRHGNATAGSATELFKVTEAGETSVTGNLTVSGNFTVNGTTTTIDTTNLAIEDNIIVLNKNVTGTPADVDAGIEVERGDETNPTFVFDEGQDIWNATTPGSGNSFIANNANGYIALGPQNTSYAHITTDRGRFYFNRDLVIGENAISSYNGDFNIRRNQTADEEIKIADNSMTFTSAANEVMHIDGTNKRVGINVSTPEKNLHVKDINEATILLQKSEAGEHYPRATVQSAVTVHVADIAGAVSANATSVTIDGSGASSFASSGRAEIRSNQDTFTYTGKTDNGDGTFTLTGIPSSGDDAITSTDDNAVVINHPETFTIDGGSGQSGMPTSGTYYIHRTGDSFTADYSFNSGTGIGTFTNVVGLRESLIDGDVVDSDSPTTAVIGFMGNDQSGAGGRVGSSISHVARSAFGDYRLDFGAGSYLEKDPYYEANEFNYSVETVPRMSILDTGLVGIGTTSPSHALHVSGSGVQKIKVESTDNEAAIELASDSSGPWVMYSANSSDDLRWYGNSAVRMVLTSAGYLGIGADTSPDYPLSISSASGLAIQTGSPLREKRIYATTSNDGSPFDEMVYHSKGSTGGWSGQHTFMVDKNGSSTYEALRIRDSGDGANSIVAVTHKLGIGTTSPSETLHVQSATAGVLIESTATSGEAPVLDLYKNDTGPAVSEAIGTIKFTGENDADQKVTYAEIQAFIEDETDATENAALQFFVQEMGTPRENLRLASNQITFNNSERNVDVLIKSDDGSHNFFSDAGNSRIGIGTNTPDYLLDVAGASRFTGSVRIENTLPELRMVDTDATNDPTVRILNNNGNLSIRADSENVGTGGAITFETSGTERMRLSDAGNLGINVTSPTHPLHIDHNATNPDTDGDFAIKIDHDSTGSASTTGDREQGGLYVDADSSTTGGDQSNEHRLYGVWSDTRVNSSGDPDAVYAVYGYSEDQRSGTSGMTTISNLAGGWFVGASDANNSVPAISGLYGVYGSASIQDTGTVSNSHSVRGLTTVSANRAANVNNIRAVSGEIDIAATRTGGDITINWARVFESVFDHNSTDASGDTAVVTDGYLYYGDYAVSQSDQVTNKWGLYINDEDKNYISGNLGIGTTSPEGVLEIEQATTTGHALKVYRNQSSSNMDSSLVFLHDDSQYADEVTLHVKQDGTGYAGVFEGGNVGIGTTSPGHMLEVAGGGSNGEIVVNRTSGAEILLQAQSATGVIGTSTNHNLDIKTNGSTRMRIESSGDVGIGTTSPAFKLDVNGYIATTTGIVHTGDTNNTITFGTDTQSFNTGSASRMDISDSGVRFGESGARITTIKDEDAMGSNSATALATQQSIKAYVDASDTNTFVIVGEESDDYITSEAAAGNANGFQFSFGNGAQNTTKSSSGSDFGVALPVACTLTRIDVTFGNKGSETNSSDQTFTVFKNRASTTTTMSYNASGTGGNAFVKSFTSLSGNGLSYSAGDTFNLRTTGLSGYTDTQVGPARMTAYFTVA